MTAPERIAREGCVHYSSKERCLTLMLDAWPPSSNNAYVNVPGKGRILGEKGVSWLMTAAAMWRSCPKYRERISNFAAEAALRENGRESIFIVEVTCFGPYSLFFTKANNAQNWDADGKLKLAQDAAFKTIGPTVDDRRVFDVRSIKCPYPKSSTEEKELLEIKIYLAHYVDQEEE